MFKTSLACVSTLFFTIQNLTPLPRNEVDLKMLSQLNILPMVHPQLVHLQPVGWIQNSMSENQKNFVCGHGLVLDVKDNFNLHPLLMYTTELSTDHFKVTSYLLKLGDRQIRYVGGALGLAFDILDKMKALPEEMVAAWLRREDFVMSMSGEPTWRTLVEALRKVGQEGTARDIEKAQIY